MYCINILSKACAIVNRLGKGLDNGFRRFIYDDTSKKPKNYVCGKDTTNAPKKVIFINGIFASFEKVQEQASHISHIRCCRVHGTYIPSNGFIYDVVQVVQSLLERDVQNDCVQKVLKNIRKRLFEVGYRLGKHDQNKVIRGKVVIFSYSGGSVVLDKAAKLLTQEERAMLRVVTLGSSVLFSQERFYKVLNVINTADFVPTVFKIVSKNRVSLEVPIKYIATGHNSRVAHNFFNGYKDIFNKKLKEMSL